MKLVQQRKRRNRWAMQKRSSDDMSSLSIGIEKYVEFV
jgi:hypothetical protein